MAFLLSSFRFSSGHLCGGARCRPRRLCVRAYRGRDMAACALAQRHRRFDRRLRPRRAGRRGLEAAAGARPAPAVVVSRWRRARRSARRCGAGVGAAGSVAGGDRCAAGGLQPLCPGSTCSARPARTNQDLPEKNLSSRDICSSAFCRALGRVLFVSSQRPSPDLAAPDLAALQLLWAGGGPLEPHLRGLFALMHCQRWTL